MTQLAPTRPTTDEDLDNSEELKYNLLRHSGVTGILPAPGCRRFSLMFMRQALALDGSLDSQVSPDQSGWDDIDIHTTEGWRRWTGLL